MSSQINTWKKHARRGLPESFSRAPDREAAHRDADRDRLYQRIGKLQVELDWLKKKTAHLDRVWKISASASNRSIPNRASDASVN
uniref:Transposase n=1 Tax=Candidatus Kentrum sp. TC TaxID=2126339 RepID=A0A450YKA0_9GAMM|nr:MAG: hypothetical protein BECKTC1821E_GA0114239_101543 [Candidatus Kentron sp. TC]